MTVDIPLPVPSSSAAREPAKGWTPRTRWQRWQQRLSPLLRRPGFSLALLILAFALLAALAPSLLTGFDPYATSPADKLSAPSLTHWFGTDELGRDLYTRVVYGARLSMLAALLAVAIALADGLSLGVLAGFAGGRVDAVSSGADCRLTAAGA